MNMTKTNTLLCLSSALAVATATAGCGSSTECGPGTTSVGGICEPEPFECGEGTFELEGECVAIDPNDQTAPRTTAEPVGRTAREAPGFVTLSTNEVATIHYTIDGSEPTTESLSALRTVVIPVSASTTVRFFAVDPAGNSESNKVEDYIVDTVGPAAPSLVETTPDAAVLLAWNNPSDPDFADVVVVRRDGAPVNVTLATDTTYTAGQDLGGGNTVLFVGTAEETIDPTAVDLVFYALFSRDSLSNLSLGAGRAVHTAAIGDQLASLTVDIAAGTVSVAAQPSGMNVVGTAQLNAGTLTVNLEITSNINRLLFSPKLVVSSLSEGSLGADGTVGEEQFVALSGAALEPGTPRAHALEIEGVTEETVSFDIHLLDNPVIAHSRSGGLGLYDIEARRTLGFVSILDEGPDGGGGGIGPAFSPNGRLLAFGSRNLRLLRIVDTTTLQVVATIALGSSVLEVSDGSVPGIAFSPDGSRLYAVSREAHLNSSGDNATVTEIDAETFEILRTATIGGRVSLQRPDLSPDGQFLAIGDRATTTIHVVDVGLMKELDGDPSTADIDGFVMAPPSRVSTRQSARRAIFGPQSRRVFVVFGTREVGASSLVLDLETRAVVNMASASARSRAECRDGRRGADGNIWVVCNDSDERLFRYDLVGGIETIVPVSASQRGGSLGVLPDGRILLIPGASDGGESVLIDPADPSQPTELSIPNNKGHEVESSPF